MLRWLIELWLSARCYLGFHQPAVRLTSTPDRNETLFSAWPKPDLCQCPHCGVIWDHWDEGWYC